MTAQNAYVMNNITKFFPGKRPLSTHLLPFERQ